MKSEPFKKNMGETGVPELNLHPVQKCFSPPWHLFRHLSFEIRSTQSKVTFEPQFGGLALGSWARIKSRSI